MNTEINWKDKEACQVIRYEIMKKLIMEMMEKLRKQMIKTVTKMMMTLLWNLILI